MENEEEEEEEEEGDEEDEDEDEETEKEKRRDRDGSTGENAVHRIPVSRQEGPEAWRSRVRAYVRAYVRACVRAGGRACARATERVGERAHGKGRARVRWVSRRGAPKIRVQRETRSIVRESSRRRAIARANRFGRGAPEQG